MDCFSLPVGWSSEEPWCFSQMLGHISCRLFWRCFQGAWLSGSLGEGRNTQGPGLERGPGTAPREAGTLGDACKHGEETLLLLSHPLALAASAREKMSK